MNSAFQFIEASFSYAGHSVIERVSIDIRPGTFTVLFGRNGSGKSTILRLMGKILTGHSGRILCCGRDLAVWDHKEFATTVGFLGQHHRPVFPFTVEDVIMTGRAGHINFLPSVKDAEAVDEIIRELELQSFRTMLYTKLSGGEQQMVLLARAMVNKPSILLLDEPTNHLDFTHQLQMMNYIRSLVEQRKMTVVSAIHDPNTAFLYGDDILFVHERNVLRNESNTPLNNAQLKLVIPSHTTITENGITLIIPK